MINRHYILGILAYVIPSFIIAYVWHLVAFAHVYDKLEMYRENLIVPLGLVTIIIQGILFGLAYQKIFGNGTFLADSIKYALFAGLLSVVYHPGRQCQECYDLGTHLLHN